MPIDYGPPPAAMALLPDKPIIRYNASTQDIFKLMSQGQIATPTKPFDIDQKRKELNLQLRETLKQPTKYNESGFSGPINLPNRPNTPYKGIVFHLQAKPEDREKQTKAMETNKVGYNALVENEGVFHYAPPTTLAQHIQPPTSSERKATSIDPMLKKDYKKWSNSNTFSIAISNRLTEQNAPILFDVAAKAFATHNIPLDKKNIIGHGQIQHGSGREKLGANRTPEGLEMQQFIHDNWDLFVERVNSYKPKEVPSELPRLP